jgi:hypothetical protein
VACSRVNFTVLLHFFEEWVLFRWFIGYECLEILCQYKRLFKNLFMCGQLRPTAEELSSNSCGGPE